MAVSDEMVRVALEAAFPGKGLAETGETGSAMRRALEAAQTQTPLSSVEVEGFKGPLRKVLNADGSPA